MLLECDKKIQGRHQIVEKGLRRIREKILKEAIGHQYFVTKSDKCNDSIFLFEGYFSVGR